MKKRYWLRGGLILATLYLILVIFAIISSSEDEVVLGLNMISPFTIFLEKFSHFSMGNIPLVVMGGLLCWFIIGALIGWLLGKIKNRKSNV